MEIRRDRYLNRLIARKWNGSVKVITGVRRCGKSYLLFTLFRNHLISEGVPDENIIAIALDDFSNIWLRDAKKLYNHVASAVEARDGPCYVLLDEIQLVPDFYEAVNGLRHLEDVDIYITGSNSRFLSSDIITDFRGRGDEVRIRPLSFGELCSAYPDKDTNRLWREYMMFGGMPELIRRPDDEQKASYLSNLVKEVYLKDIEERAGARMPEDLSSVYDLLCSSVGSLTNPVRIQNTMATVNGSKMAANTITRYIDALCDAFLFEKVARYDIKGRRMLDTPFKYYAVDVGLRNVRLNFRQQEPTHIMENIIYDELRSRGYNVDVGTVESRTMVDGKQEYRRLEVDFVVNMMDSRWYIQSSFSIQDEEKMEQEIRPFRKIPDSFRKILVTGDDAPPWTNDEGVLIVGIKDFLLDEGLMRRRSAVVLPVFLLHVCVDYLYRAYVPAHGAAVALLGAPSAPVSAGLVRIYAGVVHRVPVQDLPGSCHALVPFPADASAQVPDVGGDLGCYDPFPDIVGIRQGQVLGWGQVA